MIKKPQFFSVRIPFSGFYNSVFSDTIEISEELIFTSSRGELYWPIYEDFFKHVDYKEIHENYAIEYVKRYAIKLGIEIHYEELASPKEYNYETDRIFAKISRSDLAKILKSVRGKKLNAVIRRLFTSRSGFISNYSNDIRDWGRISNWDHNQWYAVLVAYDFKDITQQTIAEDIYENELVESWLYEAADYEGKLAIKFANILNSVY